MQNDRLNRVCCVLLSVFTIFAPLQPSKTTFAAVFLYVVCARTLYIRDTPESVLFAVCSRFYLTRYKVSVLPFEFLCSRFLAWYYMLVYLSYLVRLQPSFSVSVFTRFLFHEICAWNIMQVSAYLCKVKMYIYTILW